MKGKQGTKGFTDGAVVSLDNDLFDVEKYINGLSSFIEKCETPMTIAIQGDWGSGKTSVMNMVKEKLDKNNIIPVWFNTWKFSQFNMEEQLSVTFLSYLLKELSAGLSDKFQKRVERTIKTIGKLAFMSANVAADLFAGGMPEAINDAKEEMFSKNSIDTIDSLKSDFQNTISELLEGKGDGSRVVMFIDDLDRLRPGLAVGLLEILKIFLDCDKCVYVLAVDYEVVVQGIKEKYNGNLDGQKGRKFFDKIIQVPFKMPVAHYNIDNYVNKALEEIGVETGGDVRDYTEIITYSAGCNPRTMKRLFNAYLLLSNVYSASISFISSPCLRIFSRQIWNASFSFSRFFSSFFISSSVAMRMTGFSGSVILSSSTSFSPTTTEPNSTPRAVSTITLSPLLMLSLPGAKK